MVNLYPNSGATLKKWVRILSVVGYLVSDLLGVGVGIFVWILTRVAGMNYFASAFLAWGSAALVAAPLLFVVWFKGLVKWTISDAEENSRAIAERQSE